MKTIIQTTRVATEDYLHMQPDDLLRKIQKTQKARTTETKMMQTQNKNVYSLSIINMLTKDQDNTFTQDVTSMITQISDYIKILTVAFETADIEKKQQCYDKDVHPYLRLNHDVERTCQGLRSNKKFCCIATTRTLIPHQ